jgi:MFS family permease
MDSPAPHALAAAPEAVKSAAANRTKILLYCSVIMVALNFISPAVGFHVVPLSFVLKNKLHLSANALATFALWAGIPAYLSFAFGVVRDFWSPFGMGDRGYYILFGFLSAVVFTVFAFLPVSEPMLLTLALFGTFCFLFLWGAWNGMGSMIGQHYAMSGRISSLWNFSGTVTTFVALLLGGILSDRLETMSTAGAVRTLFLLVAALMVMIAAYGFLNPAVVFADLAREPRRPQHLRADFWRLARHRPIYAALGIFLLWNFSPATGTVLQYFMSNTLHASDAQWGAFNAIYSIAFVPTFLLFGFLSPRYSLEKLLWLGTAIAVPQMLPLLFIHSANAVLIAGIPMGLMGGIATAAYMDLLIRACPKGLEGTLMMFAWSMYALAQNFGNLLGTELYEHHGGFPACVLATTLVYALMLPALLFVPKALIALPDGQHLAEPPKTEF